MPQDWAALGLERRPAAGPSTPTNTGLGSLLSRVGRFLGLDRPSVLSRMQEQTGLANERFLRGERGPAPPGSREAELALGIAGDTAMGGVLAGPKAATANLGRLKMAREFEKGGVRPEAIWRETGWWRSPDEQWRFEIDDSAARMLQDPMSLKARAAARIDQPGELPKRSAILRDVLEHPELERSYPELFQRTAEGAPPDVFFNTFSRYGPEAEEGLMGGFTSATEPLLKLPGFFELNTRLQRNPQTELSTLLHEIQHWVQNREGFEGGGNPGMFSYFRNPKYRQKVENITSLQNVITDSKLRKAGITEGDKRVKITGRRNIEAKIDELARELRNMEYRMGHPFENYQKLMGEAEARAVQERINLGPQGRNRYYPPDSYDRDISSLIPRPPS